FDVLHAFEQFDRFAVSFRETFYEIAAKAQMTAVQHEGVDVAPQFVEIRYEADFALERLYGWDGQIGANFRRMLDCRSGRDRNGGDNFHAIALRSVGLQQLL